MTTNLQDFSALVGKKVVADNAATAADFVPITFRRKSLQEWHNGYYKAVMADGQTHFLEAATALDALEQATMLGNVLKVERTALNRARMIEAQNLADIIDENAKKHGIAPGKTLLSFEEMRALRLRLAAETMTDVASTLAADAVAAIATAAPVAPAPAVDAVIDAPSVSADALSAFGANMDLSAPLLTPEQVAAVMEDPEPAPLAEAPMVAAVEEPATASTAPAAAAEGGEGGLTPEEIERLLNGL